MFLSSADHRYRSREADIDREVRALLQRHGSNAVYVALNQLNESIDRRDRSGRDFWAQVVHLIHAHQRSVGSR
jgi:hypothetical protein